MTTYRLLHVEDSPDDAQLVRHALDSATFEFTVMRVETELEYLSELDTAPPDAIVCDYNLPEFSAERALEIIRARHLDVPFIVVSHHLDETEAVVAMQNGASDYLSKRNLRRLPKAIESAIERASARREKVAAEAALRKSEAVQRGILNSLLSRIVLVDGKGAIMAVNKAWQSYEGTPGGTAGGQVNYLESLRRAGERGDESAAELAEGLRAVIARETSVFSMEYQVSNASGTRWYIARAMPLEGSGEDTVVSHRDVTDRMLGHVALDDANKRLRALSKRMLALQEEERRVISRELHDDVGQTLGALKIGLHRLSTASATEQPALLSECLGAAGDALEKLRQLAMDLRPPQLDQLGLREALEWLAHRQSAASGIAVSCKFTGIDERPPAAIESTCYRIAQEALNNATRHARAKEVTIGVESDGALFKLFVRDDGVGFDEKAARKRVLRTGSMGLVGMEERAQLAGGRLKLRSTIGAGTIVSAIFPLLQKGGTRLEAQPAAAAT